MKKILMLLIIIVFGVCMLPSQTICKTDNHEYRIRKPKKKLKKIYIPYDKSEPHYNPNIKALFYIVGERRDTFYYAVQQNDSIFLWAIVKGKYVRLIRDLN